MMQFELAPSTAPEVTSQHFAPSLNRSVINAVRVESTVGASQRRT